MTYPDTQTTDSIHQLSSCQEKNIFCQGKSKMSGFWQIKNVSNKSIF
jgi:hypothetical protein